MGTPDIAFVRIDNRLVHRQVGVAWIGAVSANLVIIANGNAFQDKVRSCS
ncbi:PTS sugar transporter subunit IIB [Olsenella sp. Marseille-P4559]|nr:PTS sugar transporter subunit IIB [Olsenella sp. Marseille-P4559]